MQLLCKVIHMMLFCEWAHSLTDSEWPTVQQRAGSCENTLQVQRHDCGSINTGRWRRPEPSTSLRWVELPQSRSAEGWTNIHTLSAKNILDSVGKYWGLGEQGLKFHLRSCCRLADSCLVYSCWRCIRTGRKDAIAYLNLRANFPATDTGSGTYMWKIHVSCTAGQSRYQSLYI